MAGHTLTLGAGGQAPTWVADPTRGLQYGSGGFLLNKYSENSDLPFSTAGGANGLRRLSFLFYLKINSSPTSGQWFCQMSPSSGHLKVTTNSSKIRVERFWNGSNSNIVDGTSTLTNGQELTVGGTNGLTTGEKLKVFINGVKEAEVSLGGNVTGFVSQPTIVIGADFGGFTSAAPCPGIIGRFLLWDGEMSEAQMLAAHLALAVDYPGLP